MLSRVLKNVNITKDCVMVKMGRRDWRRKGNWKRKKEIEVGGVKFDNGNFLFYHFIKSLE